MPRRRSGSVFILGGGTPQPLSVLPRLLCCAGATLPRPSVALARRLARGGAMRSAAKPPPVWARLRPPAVFVGSVPCLFCCLLLPFVLDRRAVVAALFG